MVGFNAGWTLTRMRVYIFILVILKSSVDGEWSYSGQTGPDYWGSLYPHCKDAQQSPVKIIHEEATPNETLTSFRFHGYDDTRTLNNLTVWNDGYTVTVRVHGDLKIEGGGLDGKYSLQHFHFHWGASDRVGSEHWLDGKIYPLEMHLVHKSLRHKRISSALSDPTGLAVLGIFAKIGKPHPYFQAIIDNLRLLDIGDYANVRPFPLAELLPDDKETYYRYGGSLTTPPCSESVVWTVFREAIEISEEQIEQIRALSSISNITDNFRPVQLLNGRNIYVRKKSAANTVETKIITDGESSSSNNTNYWDPTGGASAVVSTMFLILSCAVLSTINQ